LCFDWFWRLTLTIWCSNSIIHNSIEDGCKQCITWSKPTEGVFLFQDVLDSKNSAIKDLQYELARVCKVSFVFLINLSPPTPHPFFFIHF
jgi:hypothetical protein